MGYEAAYARYAALTEEALRTALQDPPGAGPGSRAVLSAMRYSLFGGGKRLRPVLLLAAHALYEEDPRPALPFAAALEMLHTYSLIHDDLPAMDNDEQRRGRPACHVAFGEAMAILAGDGLLNGAYELMASSPHPRALEALGEVARRAGVLGMVGGQAADMDDAAETDPEQRLLYIHRHKTAALITAPVLCAMALAGAPPDDREAGARYGEALGMAFQIVDDLLDLDGGKDAAAGKLSWPGLYGRGPALSDAARFTRRAVEAAEGLGGRGSFLAELARRSLTRVQ